MTKITKAWKENVVAKFMTAQTWEALKAIYIECMSEEHSPAMEKWYDVCFENCAAVVKDKHVSMDGKAYEKKSEDTTEEYRTIVKTLLAIDEIKLEQCGTWLYISGETKKHLEEIRKVNESLKAENNGYFLKFCKKQKMWAMPPKNWKPKKGYHKSWTHDKVQSAYGSRYITEEDI